jgi:hypothetical protein
MLRAARNMLRLQLLHRVTLQRLQLQQLEPLEVGFP